MALSHQAREPVHMHASPWVYAPPRRSNAARRGYEPVLSLGERRAIGTRGSLTSQFLLPAGPRLVILTWRWPESETALQEVLMPPLFEAVRDSDGRREARVNASAAATVRLTGGHLKYYEI